MAAAACLLFACLFACEQPPAAESLKVWTREDHHSADDDRPAPKPADPAARTDPAAGATQLVDVTWRQQCASCHGVLGRGDGPMGPMVHAPDLARSDWQAKVSDAEIASTIRTGRNKMPRFDLPDPVLQGLVARIRSLAGP